VEAEWLNMIQEEGANLVLSAGLALNKADRTQWATAIGALIAAAVPPFNPADYVLKAGDTMTGFLFLNADPNQPMHAATKQYVDNGLNALPPPPDLAPYVLKAGDTMGGFLFLSADPTAPMHAATKQYVDANSGAGGITDAPSDGEIYGRRDAAWTIVPTGGAGINDAPNDGTLYGRQSLTWVRAVLPAELAAYVLKAGDVMTGDLTTLRLTALEVYVNNPGSWSGINLVKNAQGTFISSKVGLLDRWSIQPGNADAESGANAGTNFIINRHRDDGTMIETALRIDRASGSMSMPQDFACFGLATWLHSDTTGGDLRFGLNIASHHRIREPGSDSMRVSRIRPGIGEVTIFEHNVANRLINLLGPCAGAGPYVDTSDIRGKRDIAPATVGLAEVLQLEPINFIRLPPVGGLPADDVNASLVYPPEIGFSAQQVQPIIPEAVPIAGIELPDGTGAFGSESPSLGLITTPIVAALVNAVKELHAMIVAPPARA
jgi:Chaperone of endosialidase